MKKLLALLLAFLLAVPSGAALAQERKNGFWDKVGESLNELKDAAQEKAGDAVQAISEKAGEIVSQAQEKAGEAGKAISEKAGEIAGQAQEKAEEVGKAISEKAGEIAGQAQEKAEEVGKAISEKAGEIAGEIQKTKDELPEKARDAALELAGKALQAWWQVQDAVEAGKEKAANLLGLAKEGLPNIWEKIKKAAAKATETVKEFVREKLQQLLDWIKGNEKADGQTATPRVLYFDVFYFGMPLSEAKVLGIGPALGTPAVDEANGVQYWTVYFGGSGDTATILFDGLGKDAPLSEIIYTVIDDKGTVDVTEENAASQETIDAVYNSISSWFSGELEISLGDDLLLPIYPGVLAEDSAVSRVRMFLYADGEGCDAATHFVLTGENRAVNIVQYQYLDAEKLEALLAE